MNNSKHCELCEKQLYDFKSGTLCEITQERPSFNKKCDKIIFGDKHEEVIKNMNINFQKLKREKTQTSSKAFLYLSVAITFILTGAVLLIFLWDNGYIGKLPFIIIGAGILALPKAIGPYQNFKQKMQVALKNKQELDLLLSMYNIKYDIDIKFSTDRHGNLSSETDLQFSRKHYR